MEANIPDRKTIENLCDAGCDEALVRSYCELEGRCCPKPQLRLEQLRLLGKYRRSLLDQLHSCQKKIDCLDYLIYRLRGEQAQKEDGK